MLTPRTAWGLDIGENTVKAVKMRRTGVGAELLAFDSVERGIPSDESGDKDYHLREAVTTLAARNKFGRMPIVVSIPEPAFSRFIPLPPVDKKRIPEVVRYEARQQIPFPIEEVVWDYQPVREDTEPGEETEVAIFSLRSQFVYALLANLSLCKVQPSAVLPVPLALHNFLTFDRDVAKGTIVIDLGAGSTDMLICDPENFRVRNITVSGNGITRALADRLKIDQSEAEALKRECTDEVQAKRLFKLIQPTLNDLVGQVQRTIGFFKSQIHNVRIEQALLLGNTFKLPGVTDYFIEQLGCDLMPADVLERITLGSKVDSAALKEMLPSLAVAIGLALQGIGQGRVQVNLMPRELLRRQMIAKKRPYAAVAVGLLALMLGANLYSLRGDKGRIEAKLQYQGLIKKLAEDLERAKSNYKGAEDKVSQAVAALKQEPAQMSVGYPQKTVGYRGCLKATNALNKVLGEMSKKIVITKVTVEPAGGRLKEARGMPAMKISIEGLARDDRSRFVSEQVETRMARAGFLVLKDGYKPTRVDDGFKFTLDCYRVVDD